jgi:predicted RNase H-like HicB family nuclease
MPKEGKMNESYHFKVLYEKLHDGSFQAWVPVLPACRASGTSISQAQARIEEAIHCYCLNMLEHGATIPQNPAGLPAMVSEIQVSLSAA